MILMNKGRDVYIILMVLFTVSIYTNKNLLSYDYKVEESSIQWKSDKLQLDEIATELTLQECDTSWSRLQSCAPNVNSSYNLVLKIISCEFINAINKTLDRFW